MKNVLCLALLLVVAACSSQQSVSSAMPVLEPGAESVPEMVVSPSGDSSVEKPATTPTEASPASPESSSPSSENTASSSLREIAIEAYNFGWEPTEIRVKKGDRVKLLLSSREGTHGFGLRDFDIEVGPFAPGMSPEAVEFVADKTGSFEFRCNVPCGAGHRDMKGKFIVE